MQSSRRGFVLLCGVVILLVGNSRAAALPQVWSGLTKSFAKAPFADYELPENQDRITDSAILTRGVSGSLYNVAFESSYVGGVSPEFTEWATHVNNPAAVIAATNYDNLTFENFVSAYDNQVGNNILNGNAVLHLILDDIYLDLRFTDWGLGTSGGGGSFAYLRAVPEPATLSLLVLGVMGCAVRRRDVTRKIHNSSARKSTSAGRRVRWGEEILEQSR